MLFRTALVLFSVPAPVWIVSYGLRPTSSLTSPGVFWGTSSQSSTIASAGMPLAVSASIREFARGGTAFASRIITNTPRDDSPTLTVRLGCAVVGCHPASTRIFSKSVAKLDASSEFTLSTIMLPLCPAFSAATSFARCSGSTRRSLTRCCNATSVRSAIAVRSCCAANCNSTRCCAARASDAAFCNLARPFEESIAFVSSVTTWPRSTRFALFSCSMSNWYRASVKSCALPLLSIAHQVIHAVTTAEPKIQTMAQVLACLLSRPAWVSAGDGGDGVGAEGGDDDGFVVSALIVYTIAMVISAAIAIRANNRRFAQRFTDLPTTPELRKPPSAEYTDA